MNPGQNLSLMFLIKKKRVLLIYKKGVIYFSPSLPKIQLAWVIWLTVCMCSLCL